MICRLLPSLLPLTNNSPLRVFLKLWKAFEVNTILPPSSNGEARQIFIIFLSPPSLLPLSLLASLLPSLHFSLPPLSLPFFEKKLFVFFLYETVLSLRWHFSIFYDGISLPKMIWGKVTKDLQFLAHHEAYCPIPYWVGKYIFCLFGRCFICGYF